MADESEVILYGIWVSPYVKRVEIALRIKGIPFEYVEEDLSNKSPSLLKYNPVSKKVPVLVHGGKPICESLVIMEYIDETWKEGPRLLPEDPYRRAQVRFWANFFQQHIFENVLSVCNTEGEAQQKALNEAYDKLAVFENELRDFFPHGKPSVNSGNMGLLDILMCSLFGHHKAQEEALGIKILDPERFPLLCSWVTAMNEIPQVKEATPPHEKLVKFLLFIRQRALQSSSV